MTTNNKDEEYLCDYLSEHINQSDKCGEVYVSKSGIFSYFCTGCKEKFDEIGNFTEHILSLHLGLIPSKDEYISNNEQINNNDILVHLDIVKNIEIQIDQNENINTDTDTMKSSEKIYKKSSNKYIVSDPLDLQEYENNIESETDDKLEESREYEDIKEYSTSSDSSENSDSNDNDKFALLPFKCNLCKRSYKREQAFVAHKKRHEKLMPTCQHCGKNFGTYQAFKSHNQILCEQRINQGKKIILEVPEYKCKYCDQIFKRIAFLKKHEERHENPPCECSYCPKKFMRKQLLEDHERTHTGERPYKCTHCPVAFANYTNLKRHILIHVGERTYFCTFGCGKAFYVKRERAGHERSHTGEKPFVCELCGKYFAFQSQLTVHKKRLHMDKKNWPHKCQQCNKVFVKLIQLQEHSVVHTGEKPFACNQCPRRFGRITGLREHKKLHSDDKKHVCIICNKAFAQTAGLYGHMKSHGIVKKNISDISE